MLDEVLRIIVETSDWANRGKRGVRQELRGIPWGTPKIVRLTWGEVEREIAAAAATAAYPT